MISSMSTKSQFEVDYTYPYASHAAQLINELSQYLEKLTGDNGKGSYDVELFNKDTDAFVVLRVAHKPIACGAIRFVDQDTCEIKRMYSRQRGTGSEMLYVLENKARLLGYSKAILSARKINRAALDFYRKHNYQDIPAFGKYRTSDLSICLGKQL